MAAAFYLLMPVVCLDTPVPCQNRSRAFARQLRPRAGATPAYEEPDLQHFDILTPGVQGSIGGDEWHTTFNTHLRARLRRLGSIANGDCGPASAYYAEHGRVATPSQAAKLRQDVTAYSDTTAGQLYYVTHQAGELEQRAADLNQALWKPPLRWVTPDFMTVFGGMTSLNVFLLSHCRDTQGVNVGVRLMTYGHTLMQTDEENCCCVYFQYRSPSQLDHFEAVVDTAGRHRWKIDDPIVQQCLWAAMAKMKMTRSVRDMRQKQLVAAQNRINATNETFQVGDLAWLTVPGQVIDSTTTTLKRLKSKRSAEEGKMLVKIARIHTDDLPGWSLVSLSLQVVLPPLHLLLLSRRLLLLTPPVSSHALTVRRP